MQPKLILVAALGLALGVGVAAAVWTLRGGASAGSTAGRGAGPATAGAAAAGAASKGSAATASGPAGTTATAGADPNAAPGSADGLPNTPDNLEWAKDAPPGADGVGEGAEPAGDGMGEGEGDAGTEGEPQLRFSADKEGIQGAVRDARPKLKECYEGWLKADGKLGGSLKLTFTIAPPKPGESPEGGDPIAVIRDVGVIHSELGNMAMEGCALNAMSGLQFDAPEAEVVVNYPLVFEADSAEEPAGDSAGEANGDAP